MRLFDILDKIGVSEKMRQLYKDQARHYEISYYVDNSGKEVSYNFGSLSEGTTTPGMKSDFDIVTYKEDFPLVLRHKDAPKHKLAACLHLDPETAPGYVKLQIIYNGIIRSASTLTSKKPIFIERDRLGRYCLKDMYKDVLPEMFRGPAATYTRIKDEPYDNVFSLRCRQWPLFANEWITRERYHAWPDKQVIGHCQKLGFFVVSTGHPDSKEKHLEWRVSFSVQERLLMYNLTEVQHKCFVLLKLINKDLFQRTIGECFTSYHCKTCMLYTIEQNPQSIWYPENLFECVIKCLTLLLEWTRKGNCPNYFIPKENMFDGKVRGETQIKATYILENILAEGEYFLEKINMDNVGMYFKNRNSKYEIGILEKKSNEAISRVIYKIHTEFNIRNILDSAAFLLYDRIFKRDRKQTAHVDYRQEVVGAIVSIRKLVDWLSNEETLNENSIVEIKNVTNLILPFLHSSLACHLFTFSIQCENIQLRQKYLDLSNEEFQKSMVSDVASSRLKYITSLYLRGKYDLCQQELVSLERHIKSDVISVSPFRLPDTINFDLKNKLTKHNYDSKYLLHNHVCASIILLPTELQIIPFPLQFEMFRSTGILPDPMMETINFWQEWAVVDCSVYLYFLWYMLERARNSPLHARSDVIRNLISSAEDSLQKRSDVIQKLISSAGDSLQKRSDVKRKLLLSAEDSRCVYVETAFNLLAWIFISEDNIPQAIRCLVRSWYERRSYRSHYYTTVPIEDQFKYNAAKWIMLLLLKKVWFSKMSVDNNVENMRSFCFKCVKSSNHKLMKCPTCKTAQYCSNDCQKRDLITHKQFCKMIS